MPVRLPRLQCVGALVLYFGLAAYACAQWAWKDESGHIVYSDTPPPPTIKVADILRQPTPQPETQSIADPMDNIRPGLLAPGGTAPSGQAGTASAAPATPVAAPHPPTAAEQEQAFRKRRKERADAEKKQADEQAQISRDADDCRRAKGYLRMLQDGGPLVRTNEDGSREALDDQQRTVEVDRARGVVQQTCH